MSEVVESGVFRSKLFGGFDKKEVFGFFDQMKRDFNAEKADLENEIEQLKAQISKMKSAKVDEGEKIALLENQLKEAALAKQQLENSNEQSEKAVADKLSSIDAQLNAALERNAALARENLQLRDMCEQMKQANVQALGVNEKISSENLLLAQKSERLMNQLDTMDKKVLQYEQNNSQFVAEIGRLKSVSQELSRRLSDSEENISYKERYNDLSQKVTSTQAEIASLKDILDDEKHRRDQLESAIHELATIDYSVFDSLTGQLTDLVSASQNIKSTVFSALEKCGEPSNDEQGYNSIKYSDNADLFRQMSRQIDEVNSMIKDKPESVSATVNVNEDAAANNPEMNEQAAPADNFDENPDEQE